MRSLVLFAALTLALAGCSGGASVTLEQEDLTNASGKDHKTVQCDSGEGKVTYEVKGTAGQVKIQVEDATDSGEPPMDKSDVQGIANGEVDGLRGDPGTWTLTVDRSDFSGSYTVTLAC